MMHGLGHVGPAVGYTHLKNVFYTVEYVGSPNQLHLNTQSEREQTTQLSNVWQAVPNDVAYYEQSTHSHRGPHLVRTSYNHTVAVSSRVIH